MFQGLSAEWNLSECCLGESLSGIPFLWNHFVHSEIQMRYFLLSVNITTPLILNKLFDPGKTMACLSLGSLHHLPAFGSCPFAFLP